MGGLRCYRHFRRSLGTVPADAHFVVSRSTSFIGRVHLLSAEAERWSGGCYSIGFCIFVAISFLHRLPLLTMMATIYGTRIYHGIRP